MHNSRTPPYGQACVNGDLAMDKGQTGVLMRLCSGVHAMRIDDWLMHLSYAAARMQKCTCDDVCNL